MFHLRPPAWWPALALVLATLAVLAGGGIAPASAERNEDPNDPGDPQGPALKFVTLDVGAPQPFGKNQTIRFTTNFTAQETVATVYYTPTPDSPLTDVLATTDHEGIISWPTAPRFAPGTYSVTLEVGKETQSITARRTFTVNKGVVSASVPDPDLQVVQHRQVSMPISLATTAGGDAVPSGAYTLLARPLHGGADVVVKDGGYEGFGPHVFDLQPFASAHTGTWELHFLTSETPLLDFSSNRVATLAITPGKVPTTFDLPEPTSAVPFGGPNATVPVVLHKQVDAGPLSGRVRLLEDGIPTGLEVEVDDALQASLPIGDLPVGEHHLSLEYLGSDTYEGAVSEVRTFIVRRAATSTRVVPPGRKVRSGDAVKVAVTTPESQAAPSGTVTLREGTRVLGEAPVNARGIAAIRLPLALPKGTHAVVATYAGSGTHEASTSPLAALKAAPRPAKVTGRITRHGRAVQLTARVKAPAAAGKVVGRIKIRDGKRVVRTVILRAGAAGRVQVKLTGLKPGRHRLTVRYLGSPTVAAAAHTWTIKVPHGR